MDTLKHVVVAQLRPRNTVRALVLGIGAKPWVFSVDRAKVRCRKAFPHISDSDLVLWVQQLALEAEAATFPMRQFLGATAPKRVPTAVEAKRKMLRRPGIRSGDPDWPLQGSR